MKRFTFLKAFMLSCFMAAVFMLPMSLNAQNKKSDNFFQNDEFNGDGWRDAITFTGISNYGIGETVPVGSGLLVLAGLGAGYAVARRKRKINSRKGVSLFLAFTLILGLTQCKKNVEQIVPNAGGEINGTYITLSVNDGSKVIVNPTGGSGFATVTFETGDKIYVGNNGKYCGCLTYNSSTNEFAGPVNPESTSDYLHFYFLGNKAGDLNEGDTECTFNIIDQTSKYPVISYAHSTSLYDSETSEYNAKLQNYCSIVKFVTSCPTDKAITITGMKNQVTVHFNANNGATVGAPYEYGVVSESNGNITLHAEGTDGTEKWAILLPQAAVNNSTASATGLRSAQNIEIPALSANTYSNNGIKIYLALPGVFLVNGEHHVMFAPGNVQYRPTTDKWRFAEHQWDIIGTDNKNVILGTSDGWMDLFGWATGQNPTNNGTLNTDYPEGVPTYHTMRRINDWGKNFTLNANGTDDEFWTTITANDFYTIITYRTEQGVLHHYKTTGVVHGVKGLILLPDDWYSIAEKPTITIPNTTFVNTISDDDWSQLEALGCVFLPIAGYRNPSYSNSIYSLNEQGYYWTSIETNDQKFGAYLRIKSDDIQCDVNNSNTNKSSGCSVRLAHFID